MKYAFLSRLKEPSTWAGIAVLGSIFGIKELEALGSPEIIAGLAALAAILLKEKGSTPTTINISTTEESGQKGD